MTGEVATIVDHALVLRRLAQELPRYRFRFHDEKRFGDGLARVLEEIGIGYQREYRASEHDRFDFFLDAGVVLEAKIDGSFATAFRQVHRYCGLDCVNAVALVTNRLWTNHIPPKALRGKAGAVIRIYRVAI